MSFNLGVTEPSEIVVRYLRAITSGADCGMWFQTAYQQSRAGENSDLVGAHQRRAQRQPAHKPSPNQSTPETTWKVAMVAQNNSLSTESVRVSQPTSPLAHECCSGFIRSLFMPSRQQA
jgi:hypothetical protein